MFPFWNAFDRFSTAYGRFRPFSADFGQNFWESKFCFFNFYCLRRCGEGPAVAIADLEDVAAEAPATAAVAAKIENVSPYLRFPGGVLF